MKIFYLIYDTNRQRLKRMSVSSSKNKSLGKQKNIIFVYALEDYLGPYTSGSPYIVIFQLFQED